MIILTDLEMKIKELSLFPGSLSEYDSKTGTKHEIMDTGRPKDFVQVVGDHYQCNNFPVPEYSLLSKLLNEGCVGIIRYVSYQRVSDSYAIGGYGVPVKRKE